MILGAVGSVLTSLLRIHRAAAVAAMSTGTFVVSQPLNYRGGARVEPVDASGTEKAFEPATGNLARGGTRMGWVFPGPVH
jgi:aldehyde dehydrogenase family 9 protein A1